MVGGLADLPENIEMLDVFRRSEAVPALVEEALEVMPSLKVVWMQLGIDSPDATRMAEARAAIDRQGVAALETRLQAHVARGGSVILTTHHELAPMAALRRVALGVS